MKVLMFYTGLICGFFIGFVIGSIFELADNAHE